MTEHTRHDATGRTDSRLPLTIEAPDSSPFDRRISIRVLGATPGEPVAFEAVTTDAEGVEWRSAATFVADSRGAVDLTRDAPESGSYEGVHPMGWLWSMTPGEDQLVTALVTAEPKQIELRASSGGRCANRTIRRVVVGDGVERRPIPREDLVGTIYDPPGEGPHPGVFVLHGSGGHPPALDAALLAARGYAAVTLRYFGADDALPDGIERVPLPYFDAAATWLRERPNVRDGQIGIVGHSWGALAGLLLGSRYEWVGAVVSYAGSGVVWDTPSGDPAWIDETGDPVPFVSGRGKPTLCEGQLDDADAASRRAATIPVESIAGPVLLVSGAQDPVWPARRLSEIATDRLARSAFEHPYAHLTYEDAGHFLTVPYLPKTDPRFGGTARGLARADADSWPFVLEYLDRGLNGSERDGPAPDGP